MESDFRKILNPTERLAIEILSNKIQGEINFEVNIKGHVISLKLSNKKSRTNAGDQYGKSHTWGNDMVVKLGFETPQISDISQIGNFTHLTDLDLSDNAISDIGPLSNCLLLTYLNLNNNKINDLGPIETCTNLIKLDISNNEIHDISVLSNLKSMEFLSISNNKIANLSSLISCVNLIRLEAFHNLISDISPLANLLNIRFLDLSDNQISDISPIVSLSKMTSLDLGNNNLTEITVLSKCLNLNNIDLSKNLIADISPLAELRQLTVLILIFNIIKEIPEQLFYNLYNNIRDIDVDGLKKVTNICRILGDDDAVKDCLEIEYKLISNQILTLVDLKNLLEIILIHFAENNPLESPPIEIIEKGRKSLINYFSGLKMGKDYLFEAKLLIIGEPGAGKTSLMRKLEHENNPLPDSDKTTRGIDILPIEFFTPDNKMFRINIWDFGGQQIYSATHQFFLTRRSLYVLLDDTREQKTDFNYWLQAIEVLGENSPLIIVQNQKQDRINDLDLTQYQKRFSNIKDLKITNLATLRGFKEVRMAIEYQIQQLPLVGMELPKQWIAIRNQISDISEMKPYISHDEYFEVCATFGIMNHEDADELSDTFHDLGVFLHYRTDPVLNHIVILQNKWATDAVYKVLDNKMVNKNKGIFKKENTREIWHEPEYYDKNDELLALMMKFELCYKVHDEIIERFIVPQLLPGRSPDYSNLQFENSLKVKYRYDFMPRGLLSRFIVRNHEKISGGNLVWKTGVILDYKSSKAEIIENYDQKEISIKVTLPHGKEMISIIINDFDKIHGNFSKLSPKKLVPCNCPDCSQSESPHFYNYSELERRLEHNKLEIECPRSFEIISITKLIKEIFDIGNGPNIDFPDTKQQQIKIFFSYAKEDLEFRNEIDKFLFPLKKDKTLSTWFDLMIEPGADWDLIIQQKISESDIIFCLVSADFLSKDYIWEVEIKKALELKKIIIPIILRPCLWEKTLLRTPNALPIKGKPISKYKDKDDAFTEIANKIAAMISKREM